MGDSVVPLKTSVEDMQKLVGYLAKQVGWIDVSKVEKALGGTATDDRKLSAVAALGLVQRDGVNLKITTRGQTFVSDPAEALRSAIHEFELYRATVEWLRYQGKAEATAVEIGQYWENSHADTLGGLQGTTLKAGAVCFGRVVEGAALGSFLIGRGGKETRLKLDQTEVARFVDGAAPGGSVEEMPDTQAGNATEAPLAETNASQTRSTEGQEGVRPPSLTVSTSPSVHVNVEIHIAADATAATVKEIFKNMARYVLDKTVEDDDN